MSRENGQRGRAGAAPTNIAPHFRGRRPRARNRHRGYKNAQLRVQCLATSSARSHPSPPYRQDRAPGRRRARLLLEGMSDPERLTEHRADVRPRRTQGPPLAVSATRAPARCELERQSGVRRRAAGVAWIQRSWSGSSKRGAAALRYSRGTGTRASDRGAGGDALLQLARCGMSPSRGFVREGSVLRIRTARRPRRCARRARSGLWRPRRAGRRRPCARCRRRPSARRRSW
jgi:hypothetical protein